jgi:hypothetical protein
MAKILIVKDSTKTAPPSAPDWVRAGLILEVRGCWAEIVTDEDSWSTAHTRCGKTFSDRGHLEDTIEVAEAHVDRCQD